MELHHQASVDGEVISERRLTLTIHSAIVTLELATDHHSGAKGMLGGVLDPTELSVDIHKAIAALPDACSLILEFQSGLKYSGDLMIDGSQDPATTCTGISIGFAFTMKEVQRGAVGPAAPPEIAPCP